jgi:hypothetical protein
VKAREYIIGISAVLAWFAIAILLMMHGNGTLFAIGLIMLIGALLLGFGGAG